MFMSNCSKNKIVCLFSIFVIFLTLTSCQKNEKNEISCVFNDWLNVEKTLSENDTENLTIQFEQFCKDYSEFKKSNIYRNLISISNTDNSEELTTPEILCNQINEGIQNKNYGLIRTAVFKLEQIDKKSTFESNKNYLFLNVVLIVLCLIITIGLFICLKNYEKKLEEAKQFGIYSHFMTKGIVTERSRISKEIHDTVLQDLKAINLKTDTFKASPENQKDISKNEMIKKELFAETDECIKKMRGICNSLLPSEFKKYSQNNNSLEIMLKNLTAQFTAKTKIPCVLKIQDNIEIDSLEINKLVNIFRIVQESLNNIEKHADAHKVSVVVTSNNTEQNKKSLKFFITDDGKGFDQQSINNIKKGHLGLSNMKDRAKQISGSLSVISEPGAGTEITMEIPLK